VPDEEVCVRADGGSGGRWAPEEEEDDDDDEEEANEGEGARLGAGAALSPIASGAAECGGRACFP
jgi:hypothetical protein